MGLPKEPVTLTVQQVEELHQQLRTLRHDLNNDLTIIVACAELVKYRHPGEAEMLQKLLNQPALIRDKMDAFSSVLEQCLQITKP